ncbi:DUF58 domain-containing protein [Halobacteria archaeon AArc-dxtr1]|nr:DUF58 domain-containing protein [Halobacteria archaeon AArc-dxtr1]
MRRVTRWHSGVVASIVLVAAGLLVGSSALVLAAIVPIAFVGYAALSSVPEPTAAIAVERSCTPANPLPGERVEVTLTVGNETDRTLADVRIVDRVPDGLDPVEGTVKQATTLRAGEQTSVSYALRPRHGTYAFGPTWIRLRSLSAAAVTTDSIRASGDTELDCSIPLDGLPLHRKTIPLVGAVATDSGGAGYEFHSTREYQRGDPLKRIDWRRYARTGELGTVRYREQEAASVVVLVDGRDASRVAADRGHPDGVTLAAYTGIVAASVLADVGHSVGAVGLGVRGRMPGVYTGPPAYVEPGMGADVGGRIATVCDAVAASGSAGSPADGSTPDPSMRSGEREPPRARPDGGAELATRLDALFPPNTQLVCCTPAVDDEIVDLVLALRRRGYPLSVLSPNVTGGDEVGARLEGVRRQARLERLRRSDVPVVDWSTDRTLASALARGFGEVIR